MRKLIVLTTIVVLLSGCTATYEIKISDISIAETTTIIGTAEGVNQVNKIISTYSNLSSYSKTKTADGLGVILNHEFNYVEYSDSTFGQECFENFSFGYGEEEYLTLLAENFTCFSKYPELEKVTVKIYISPSINFANYNDYRDQAYIWTITPKNASEMSINISFDKPTEPYSIIENIPIVGPYFDKVIDNESSDSESDKNSSSNDFISSQIYDNFIEEGGDDSLYTPSSELSKEAKAKEIKAKKDKIVKNNLGIIIIISILAIVLGLVGYAFIKNQKNKRI